VKSLTNRLCFGRHAPPPPGTLPKWQGRAVNPTLWEHFKLMLCVHRCQMSVCPVKCTMTDMSRWSHWTNSLCVAHKFLSQCRINCTFAAETLLLTFCCFHFKSFIISQQFENQLVLSTFSDNSLSLLPPFAPFLMLELVSCLCFCSFAPDLNLTDTQLDRSRFDSIPSFSY